MNTTLIFAALLAAATVQNPAPESSEGGMLSLNGKGKIALVNACGAPDAAVWSAAEGIGGVTRLKVECREGRTWSMSTASEELKASGGDVAVFVVNDAALPMSLIAMEAKWGAVNAKGLDDEGLKKEILRVTTVLLGGGSMSRYPASVMRPVYCPADLAKAGDLITIDSLMALYPNLQSLGLKQYDRMSYRDACEEGIAPQPTNAVQKAIWDEVHKLPTEPIRIAPETKKVKE